MNELEEIEKDLRILEIRYDLYNLKKLLKEYEALPSPDYEVLLEEWRKIMERRL